jgi:hypothetical protein
MLVVISDAIAERRSGAGSDVATGLAMRLFRLTQ